MKEIQAMQYDRDVAAARCDGDCSDAMFFVWEEEDVTYRSDKAF